MQLVHGNITIDTYQREMRETHEVSKQPYKEEQNEEEDKVEGIR